MRNRAHLRQKLSISKRLEHPKIQRNPTRQYTSVFLLGMLGFSIDFLHERLCEQTTNSLN